MLKWIRIALWCAVALAVVGAGTLYLGRYLEERRVAAQAQQQDSPMADIGGEFEVVNQDGETVTEEALEGQPSLIFFGFTHCPDVCPTTLADMSRWLDRLGDKAQDLEVYFVSVDPARDTPARLKAYLSSFADRIDGLTGTPEQIAGIADAYRVYYEKVPLEGGGYTMDHTAFVYMMDGNGSFQGTIAFEEGDDAAVAKIENLLEEGDGQATS